MRFSERTNWNTEESDLARAHRKRVAAGLPIADLTQSNPTRCGFAYPPSLLAALTDPRALDYDPQPNGLLPARQAVAAYYAAHGVALDPQQIVLTTSTSEAYSFLFRLLCDPADEILILQPGYPLFDFLAALDDVRLKAVPLVYENGWQIDPEGIRRAITPRTRAIVVVHPNNPTGHFTKPSEAAELARLCREFRLALIIDEVFLDYGLAHPSFAAQPESFAHGLEGVPVYVVSGLSKIAALPQMKAAWIVATVAGPGPRQIPDQARDQARDEALARLEVIADTFLSMNAPIQWALPAWLAGRSAIQQQIRRRVTANLAALDRQLQAVKSVQRLAVEGGWYAVLRIPAVNPDDHTVLALLERGVWVHPGYFFGLPESGWLVVSLLAPEAEFSNGVAILINYLGTNHGRNNPGR
ncbi:MAG: pyridoxal phosphate-dependent aminotransferase [Terracidiphilus sp.]|jgi:aspartate/methionine/tyrosine aminotransferase